jgi:hypothetical protein
VFSEGRWGFRVFLFFVAMIPHGPRDLPEFFDQRGDPAFSCVAFVEPFKVFLLLGCPFM